MPDIARLRPSLYKEFLAETDHKNNIRGLIRNPQVQETNRHTFDALYRSIPDTVDIRCIPSQKDFGSNAAQDPADTLMGPYPFNLNET